MIAKAMVMSVVLMGMMAAQDAAKQDAPKKDAEQSTGGEPRVRPRPALSPNTDVRRFVYTLAELDHGRRLNSRNIEVTCREDSRCTMKSGSRVPIVQTMSVPAGTNFQYVDVGLNVSMHYTLRADGKLNLASTVEMSSVAAPEQNREVAPSAPPILRQTRNDIDSTIGPNVPTVLGMVDDLNSGHTFELSVVAKDK